MALLLLVPMQLMLAGMGSLLGCPSSWPNDERERDLRNGRQWLFSIRAYCKFRAGLAWRRSSDRFNPNRLWYMNGIRCVQDVLYAPDKSPQLVLPCIDGVNCSTEFERGLAAQSRPILVNRLMAASPLFTDRRLLSHLPKMKLARMLARAIETAQPERRRA
jgi:hypothetical protein